MRCDVNLSVAPVGAKELGERTEIKNLNSFSFAAKAIEYEFARQCEMLERGKRITRQTLRYNTASGKCEVMRSKESAIDYRFFPEPDLHMISLCNDDVERIRRELPTLPDERIAVYTEELGLSKYDSSLLASDAALSDYFDEAARYTDHKKILANIIISELLRLCDAEDFDCNIPPKHLGELAELFGSERINSSTAKKLLARMYEDPKVSPAELAEREGLWQINDENELLPLITEVIKANQKAVCDYKNGKSFAIKAIIGKAMGASGGRANPRIVEELIEKEINRDN